ncbi:N-acetyl-alpha-glucosaminidase isoform X2 [Oratosquilla oratoria]
MEVKLLCFFLLLLGMTTGTEPQHWESHLDVIAPRVGKEDQTAAVNELVKRLLKDQSHLFDLRVKPSLGPQGRDTFQINSPGQKSTVVITGTTGVAAAWGLLHFLKYSCNCHVSWEADQLKLPSSFPAVQLTVTSNDRFRYYQNVCTVSYSMVWWDWTRWQREIDWMALNGINLPLAFTAQEALWMRVFKKLGFEEADLDEFFTGPAFMAWGRMGNIQAWGGPLSSSWHNQTLALQHKILNHMRGLGMIPVLPAFAGHVPRQITKLFPDAKVTQLGGWAHFKDPSYCCTFLLSPEDPLFNTIGSMFIREMQKEYNGTEHIYNCDLFNEMRPPTNSTQYLHDIGSAVFTAMTKQDPKAVWLMQGWMFRDSKFWQPLQAEALLTSVPRGRMLVLDLAAEVDPIYNRLESFYGQPFIFCMLHNYGGVNGLFGNSQILLKNMAAARHANATLIGTGLTMEGINQNYIMYDLMLEQAWRTHGLDLLQWAANYGQRRYGTASPDIAQAWKLLMGSVYNCTVPVRFHGQLVLTQRPTLSRKPVIWYEVKDVVKAWDIFVEESGNKDIASQPTFQHDLVDITRQILQIVTSELYMKIRTAYIQEVSQALHETGLILLALLDDLEELLASSPDFLLGKWITSAEEWAVNEQERQLYVTNALSQVSIWGPNGEILDYAVKQWSGITSNYFKPRWHLFLQYLEECLQVDKPFNQTVFNNEVFEKVEQPFSMGVNKTYPSKPQGDVLTIVQHLYTKYRPVFTDKLLHTYSSRFNNVNREIYYYQITNPEQDFESI